MAPLLFLCHHGIKGQRWGVLHGPPYPIEKGAPVRIRKGTKIARLSVYDESKAKGHAYVTYNKEDMARYKGFFGRKLKQDHFFDKNNKVYLHDIETREELRSPAKKERIRTFMDLYKKNPAVKEELANYQKSSGTIFQRILPKAWLQKKFADLQGDALLKKGYKAFVAAIGGNEKLRKIYMKALKKKGYNFVQDDMDSGSYGIEPGIVFNRRKSLKYRGKREVQGKEIRETLRKYGDQVNKKDKHREWE